MARDVIFQEESAARDFTFDQKVAAVFDDMVSRSVPFYGELQRMLSDLCLQFLPAQDGKVCDLGCSTGTTIDLILSNPGCPASAHAYGIDNAQAMLDQAREKLAPHVRAQRVTLVKADLDGDLQLPSVNVVLMNWTLQFVRPIHREALLKRIHAGLRPGGALLMAEKVLVEDSLLNRLYIELYYRYKARQGYTAEEIQRKRESLENVLVPYRVEENVQLLQRCGFSTVDTCFRWFNWAAFVAIKH
ncbi:MAG TPA: carboxy-S-adenosyl-L-methionine synthase CmoA [Ramlibacter sp.]|uniref:carboxy-S-adenosyl-L-methionine synthase CmoA n=1 Tax=Ramlibacter sp. TaxID=1917967 RepID=UPI002B62DF19|nr:carboxy-S-adenosyl-L-methionine synthase CmoA [Ramlibacter sp.]HVZ46366.1 carboxy-S-adenosyl-L-methionine synthase CmoA [Ramlibacter sp.]